MENIKRMLSLLLVMALLVISSGLGFSTQMMKSDVPVAKWLSPSGPPSFEVEFYVPELIYLKPSVGFASDFQYYVDCDTNGNLNKTKNKTSGVVYFKCDDASNVSISCSGANVSLGSSSSQGTTLNTTVRSGKLWNSIAQKSVSTLTWTVTYTVNGLSLTAKAYTVCYAPLVEPVGSAIRTYNNDGSSATYKAFLQSVAYMCGVHEVSGGNYTANTSSVFNLAPMLGTIIQPDHDRAVTDWLTVSNNNSGGINYKNHEGGRDYLLQILNSPTATLLADTSRYDNIDQIPNLRYGLLLTDIEKMVEPNLFWYASSYSKYESNGNRYTEDAWTNENYDGIFHNYWGTPGVGNNGATGTVYHGHPTNNGAWSLGTRFGNQTGAGIFPQNIFDGSGVTTVVRYKAAVKAEQRGEWNGNVHLVNLNVSSVNKASLRSAVRKYTNLAPQQEDYPQEYAAVFTAFFNELKAATERLGDPTNTNTANTLEEKYGALPNPNRKNNHEAIVSHKFDDGKRQINDRYLGKSGSTLVFGPNNYPGYRLNSADGYTTSTASQTAYIPRGDFQQNYYYTARTDTAYKVEHYLQNTAQNGYELWRTDDKTGTTSTTGTSTRVNFVHYTYDAGASTPSGNIAADGSLVLKLYYTRNSYDLIFNPGEGTGVMPKQSFVFGQSANLAANVFARTGYSFAGWATSAEGSVVYTDKQDYTMNIAGETLYAKWSVNTYTVSFNTEGGSKIDALVQDFATEITALADPAKTGYIFAGWRPAVPATMPAGSIECVAQWVEDLTPGLVAAEGSTTVIDNDNYLIYDLEEGISQADFKSSFIEVVGNGRLQITTLAGSFGTGAKVELIDNATDEVAVTYYIVIFGDVNGDGNVDSIDAGCMVDNENYSVNWDPQAEVAFVTAGDINKDKNIDSLDAGVVVDIENYRTVINQVTELPV